MCLFEVLLFAFDRLFVYLFMAELCCAALALFASGKVSESKFPFQTKKKGERMNKKRREQQARKDLEQTGRSRREQLTRLDVAKAAHLFSLSRRDPWNRIRRVCVKGQHWHTAGSSPPCVGGAPPPPLSGIIFGFRKEQKKRRDREDV